MKHFCKTYLLALVLFACQTVRLEQEEKPAEALESSIQQQIAAMSLEQKVAQLLFIDIHWTSAGRNVSRWNAELQEFVARYPVGGIILFRSNLRSKEQLSALIDDMRGSFHGIAPFIALDEEGGAISRLKELPGLNYDGLSSTYSLGQGRDYAEKARNRGSKIGSLLAELGFSVNMAPVADLYPAPEYTRGSKKDLADLGPIANRAFSAQVGKASAMVANFVRAIQGQGVLAVLKHFPGHGYTEGDPHWGTSLYHGSMGTWRAERHSQPFAAGIAAGAQFVMLGHFELPQISGQGVPASLSPFVIGKMLRKGLGFDGVVLSDALSMSAIEAHWDSAQAAVAFLEAGGDMPLMPRRPEMALQGILTAIERGRLSEQGVDRSLERILAIKNKLSLGQP